MKLFVFKGKGKEREGFSSKGKDFLNKTAFHAATVGFKFWIMKSGMQHEGLLSSDHKMVVWSLLRNLTTQSVYQGRFLA